MSADELPTKIADQGAAGQRSRPGPRRPAVASYRGPYLSPPRRTGSPDPMDVASVRGWLSSIEGPTAIDLFCGCGGLSLGLQQAGFTIIVGADKDDHAVETHTANLGGLGYAGDLDNPEDFLDHLTGWGITTVDLVAGGVPCQPFSRAGRSKLRHLVRKGVRAGEDGRATLWRSLIAIVARLQPRAVLLENVPDLALWDDGAVLMGFNESLRELGYIPEARYLEACDYGVPQHRGRLFIMALRDSLPAWPSPRRGRLTTVYDAISDLPVVDGAHREERVLYTGPKTPFQRLMRFGVPPADRDHIYDHTTREVRSDDVEAFAALPQGGTYEDVPESLRRYRADIFRDKYKRLHGQGLSRSITAHIAKDAYWYIHPDRERMLSVREAARIQTFPDWFHFAGTPSMRLRQIGNAVPPMLAAAVGRSLRHALRGAETNGHAQPTRQDFRDLLLNWHREHRRDLPWRRQTDPWMVLVSELCLNRMRSSHVAPIYEQLIAIAPTPAAMVARTEQVKELLDNLGTQGRAEKMLALAQEIVTHYAGHVPDSEPELRTLSGVGDYGAMATLCFGFGRRAVLLDANTERIVQRVLRRSPLRRWQLRLDLHHLAGRQGPDASFNYALLDLGALVCHTGTPACDRCPVRQVCSTGQASKEDPQLSLTEIN